MKSFRQVLKALADATASGDISAQQAKQVRQNLGIFQSSFTKKKISLESRAAKRKMVKASRKKNRAKTKGQKRNSGSQYRLN